MINHEKFMRECLRLALLGLKKTKTNPLVGCVIVHDKNIISTGYHEKFGGPHAEKNAIIKLKKKNPDNYKKLLKESTLYVNLEPCSHYGKTAPCVNLIKKYKIKQVVIGTLDPFKKVNGKGFNKLKEHTQLIVGVLPKECKAINEQYFINHKLNRPFIVLKWAESKDGFISNLSNGITKISEKKSIELSHKWRSELDAIMVGTNTILSDNPQLTTRYVIGKDPIRITIDRNNRLINKKLNIMDNQSKTIILNEKDSRTLGNLEYLNYHHKKLKKISDQKKIINIMTALYVKKGIKSILVEGGATILNNIIAQNIWDEIRIFKSSKILKKGKRGPIINFEKIKFKTKKVGEDVLMFTKNQRNQ